MEDALVIESLAPIFIDEMELFNETFVLDDDPREAISGSALLEGPTIERMLAYTAAHFGGHDKRALASLWAIDYVHVLIPAVVVAELMLNRRLPVALADTALILDGEDMPSALRIRHDGEVMPLPPQDSFTRFHIMVRDHLAPLFEALANYSGVSQRVLWNSAGNLYEAIIRGIEEKLAAPKEIVAAGDVLLQAEAWPDGWRNPLHNPMRYEKGPGDNQRWRRICCVRYLISGVDYCENCPHLLAKAANLD